MSEGRPNYTNFNRKQAPSEDEDSDSTPIPILPPNPTFPYGDELNFSKSSKPKVTETEFSRFPNVFQTFCVCPLETSTPMEATMSPLFFAEVHIPPRPSEIGKKSTKSGLWPRLRESTPQTHTDHHLRKHPNARTVSAPFISVYPQRQGKLETIGTNPVQNLSLYDRNRFNLDNNEDSDTEIPLQQSELSVTLNAIKKSLQCCFVLPWIRCVLCCRNLCKVSYRQEELADLYRPQSHNTIEYIQEFQNRVENMPDKQRRINIYSLLKPTIENFIACANHLHNLASLMDQVRNTIGLSNFHTSEPIIPIFPKLIEGRSMIGSIFYMVTFIIGQLDPPHVHLHAQALLYIRNEILELIYNQTLLWASICHLAASAEIILYDLENIIGKYLFHVRAETDLVVDTSARTAFREQGSVRSLLRENKRLNDINVMNDKVNWPLRARRPPKPDLRIVSRIEGVNNQWHPIGLFEFDEQIRIIINLIKRGRNLLADGFWLLSEFDRILHCHRPSRKESNTNTLLEDTIYIQDRGVQLNMFPDNLLSKSETESVHETARILSDLSDELYISIYAAKDVTRETQHIFQICYEYLRVSEGWDLPGFHDTTKNLQNQFQSTWAHYPGFTGQEILSGISDPVPLFNSSVYTTLIRMFPVKVAKLYVSYQTIEEMESRRNPSSHSLWDAFDVIDINDYPKHDDSKLNKEIKN